MNNKVRHPSPADGRGAGGEGVQTTLSPTPLPQAGDGLTAYIALGANLGDAQATLRVVFDELNGLPQTQITATSSLYRSPPFGENADGPDYINAVAQIITSLSPHQLLDQLQHLEQIHGRERHYQNAPRTLDLDILLYDDVTLNDERLILPHPRVTERAFVLLPLSEINEKWRELANSPHITAQRIEKLVFTN